MRANRVIASQACIRRMQGASLVEFIVVVPTLLMMLLGMIQYGLVFHAKGNLNYAVFEAARAGSVDHAKMASIQTALMRGLVPYYGGGTSTIELTKTYAKVAADFAKGAARVEILSPTKESFDDYASPAAATALNSSARVIPTANLTFLKCPMDKPGCNNNPASNSSGQTLTDATLLKLRVTYGIPAEKQVPFVGRLYTAYVAKFFPDPDPTGQAMRLAGRIPVVTHTTIRMQSEPIESTSMASNPGPGNNGNPTDPGPDATPAAPPTCPFWDPTCSSAPGGDACPGGTCPVCGHA